MPQTYRAALPYGLSEVSSMKGKRLAGLCVAIYVLFLVICSASWLWGISLGDLAAAVTHSVALEEGIFKNDTADLAVILHDGETEKLDGFTALRTADFRGSDCTDEIIAWAQAHPQVDVTYDVALPDGTRVDNHAESVSFAGVDSASLDTYIAALSKLPSVTAVDLGRGDGASALSADALQALTAAHPDLSFSYAFTAGGIDCSLDAASLDLTGIDAASAAELTPYLPCMTALSSVTLGDEAGCKLTWDEIAALEKACPQADFDYTFTLYGKSFTLADETIDLSKTEISDNGDAVVAALPALTRCKTLDMDDGGIVTGLGNDRMQQIREQFPDIDVVWRIWFGTYYSVRTDTERILASRPSVGGILYDEEVDKLKYCTKAKYIDLGHNEMIYSIGFVQSMPDLEVFIIAMNPLSDISPLASCTKLEYLEIFTTNVTDLSPLSGLTSLRHLNISNLPNLTDISPLYSLTELERLWIGTLTPIPAEQVAEMHKRAPNCTISTSSSEAQGDAWRYTWYDENNATYHWVERHEKLREQLGYNYQEYSFYWLDPKCERPAPAEYAGMYYGKTDSIDDEP